MGKLRLLILASCLVCFSLAVNVKGQSSTTLQLGTPVDGSLGPGEVHTFTLDLEENNFVQIVVEQRGIDVIVKVFSPSGKSLGEYDSPNGNQGPEHLSFIAATAGSYRVTVGPLDPADRTTGKYVIKILDLRQANEQEIKANKNLEVAKTRGLALLTDIEQTIAQIRSPFIRIRAEIQTAQLLWDSDEKRALKFITSAINNVKEFLATVDVDGEQYFQQYSTIWQLRFEIIQVLAPRDPDAALSFLYSTVPSRIVEHSRNEFLQESALELSIANEMVLNDPKRAVQIARRNLKQGYSNNLMDLLLKLKAKNPEFGSELANEAVAKLLNEKLTSNQDAGNFATRLLMMGRPSEAGDQSATRSVTAATLLTGDQYKDLCRKLFNEATTYSFSRNQPYSPEKDYVWNLLNNLRSMGAQLDTIVTGGLAAIDKKIADLTRDGSTPFAAINQYQTIIADTSPEGALQAIEKAPEGMKDQLYMQLAVREANNGDLARGKQIINDHVSDPQLRRQVLTGLEQQEVFKALGTGKIEDALRSIAAIRDPRDRAAKLAQVVNRIGPGQKRAAALGWLEQARSTLGSSPQAQNQEQMTALLEIGRAFSRYDSKRAAEIIEPLIDQFNDICAAARTMDGFGSEYYQDEELNTENGNSVAGIGGQITNVLGSLALVNFDRAKSDADRIRLPEVRLKAYLDIAQQTIQGREIR